MQSPRQIPGLCWKKPQTYLFLHLVKGSKINGREANHEDVRLGIDGSSFGESSLVLFGSPSYDAWRVPDAQTDGLTVAGAVEDVFDTFIPIAMIRKSLSRNESLAYVGIYSPSNSSGILSCPSNSTG